MCHEDIKIMFLVPLTFVSDMVINVINVNRVITVISVKSVWRYRSDGGISSIFKYL